MTFSLVKLLQNYFLNRNERKRVKKELLIVEKRKWISKLNELGFKNISYPIFIVNEEWDGIHLKMVSDIEEFAMTNSIHYWQLDSDTKLLDSNGNHWSWKYDKLNKTNLPGSLLRTLSLEEVKETIIKGSARNKLEKEIKSVVIEATSIKGLFESLTSFNF